jgi:hypothetical protein
VQQPRWFDKTVRDEKDFVAVIVGRGLITNGNPAADIDPSPKSVPTSTVFSSSQLTSFLAAGRLNPPATNSLVAMSNSRTTIASEPPRDR